MENDKPRQRKEELKIIPTANGYVVRVETDTDYGRSQGLFRDPQNEMWCFENEKNLAEFIFAYYKPAFIFEGKLTKEEMEEMEELSA